MTIKAAQIPAIENATTSLPAVAGQMTCAAIVVPTLDAPLVVAGWPTPVDPECPAMAKPHSDSPGSPFDSAA
jgi:hypothetical protein